MYNRFSDAISDVEMTAWLLDHGSDPNQLCFIDLTPLSLAVESAPISVISLMFSHGGDVKKGQLLYEAVERQSDTIDVLKFLIEKGASLDSTVSEDLPSWTLFHFMGLGTALHKAAELGKVDVVRYLISEGANQSAMDANGRTAVDCAKMLNQWQVIEVWKRRNSCFLCACGFMLDILCPRVILFINVMMNLIIG